MAELNNVIEHLQIIRTWAELDGKMGRGMEPKCCLRVAEWVDDALEVLKGQEPRVLTLKEWISAQEPADGECMCYEIKGKGLQSMLVKAFDGARHLYGKAFRVWTVRPTDAQRKAVKWK